jgi:hypothetical protein
MEIVNCTPHAITVCDETYEPSGLTIRLDYETSLAGAIGFIPVSKLELVGHNLPEKVEGKLLLVSAMVLKEFPERDDLIAPNTNEAVRNEKGHIVSVPGFICN